MRSYKEHLLFKEDTIKQALAKLNELAADAMLFVVDEQEKLVGSLTDGDIRRGLLRDFTTQDKVIEVCHKSPRFVTKGAYNLDDIIAFRQSGFRIIPVLDSNSRIINIINFRLQDSYLPVDAVVMAGGRGSRLRPMTDTVPKPLLKVGEKAIIEHNIDRLRKFGVDDFWITLRYLGEQLKDFFGDGKSRNVNVNYVWEDEPLGTVGAVSKITEFSHDYVLITNSDLLTALDYESFFLDFVRQDADMSVVTIPYDVDIPYAVIETKGNLVTSFKEKPTYTYYSNGGIYLVKREILEHIPENTFFNSTDLMQSVIDSGKKLVSYPMRQYWLDIGKPDDFTKAQADIAHLKL